MMCDVLTVFSTSFSSIMEFAKPAIIWTAEEATRMATAVANNSSAPGGIFPQVIN
jgi:hypothetical protein